MSPTILICIGVAIGAIVFNAENAFIGFVFGCIAGHAYAHYVIVHECKNLGRFYVNDEVFECSAIKNTETQQQGKTQ